RGSVVPRIAPQIVGFAIYSTLIVLLTQALRIDLGGYGLAPFTLLGVTLSIYLGFRNNAAYDRGWGRRKGWGQVVERTRNLARSATALIPAASGEVRPLLMGALAFCHFLRGQLRNIDANADAAKFLGADIDAISRYANKGDAVLRGMGQRLGTLKASG